jgi:DNA-directed RNA polymerase specialized sigma24 family protein
LDPSKINDLAESYKAGIPINDLAARFGIDRSVILKHLKAMDIPRRYPALDAEQSQEVCRLYQVGLNSTEIGKLFDVSADTVLRALRRNGIPIRERG